MFKIYHLFCGCDREQWFSQHTREYKKGNYTVLDVEYTEIT